MRWNVQQFGASQTGGDILNMLVDRIRSTTPPFPGICIA